jgi:hypothetical protein
MEDKIELFRKGALVAQHPSKFEEVEELDESEKQTLRDEIIRRLYNTPLFPLSPH